MFYEQLARELAFEEEFGAPKDLTDVEDTLVAPPERTAADQLVGLIADAVRTGTISRRHGQLVVDTRLRGIPTQRIASSWHRKPQTVRKMRQRAEAVLADVAVA